MIVFKLSWLPYILILAGIILAADGQPAALILTVAGGAWVYFDYQKKQASAPTDADSAPYASDIPNASGTPNASAAGEPHAPAAAPVAETPVAPVTPVAPAKEIKFCCNCGAKAIPGSVFCSECGEKLR